jgi:hypothetical protein
VSRNEIIFGEPLPVRAACHARIGFDVASPRRAEVIIEHLHVGKLLARECRPLAVGASALEIKTHPEASHIACLLQAGDRPIDGVRFNVDCGERIERTPRNFIVVGAMKAGTTTLFELLAQHPALCRTWAELPGVSFTKEINYFRDLYRKGDTPLHYDWRFPFDAARHAWTLDVSPGYAQWPRSKAVPARIASLGGQTRLAYILREPIDRIESHLAHTLGDVGKITNLQHYIRTSSYAMQLDKFTAHIERDDILLLDFEQLRRNPAVILAQVCDFLAIDRFAGRSVVRNRRSIEFRLDARRRAELAEAVRPDVQRLISVYGFRPAERWLRRSALSWIGLSAFRR